MANNPALAYSACRMCMADGIHETDLFDANSEELRQTITKLYEVEVIEFNFIIIALAASI